MLNDLHEAKILDKVDSFLDGVKGKGKGMGMGMGVGVEQTGQDEAELLDSLGEYVKRDASPSKGAATRPFQNEQDMARFEKETHLHPSENALNEPLSERPLLLSEVSDHPMLSALEAAEKFIVEGMTQGISPFDSMDPMKLEKNAKPFKKPVKLSALRKVLQRDPDYFKK